MRYLGHKHDVAHANTLQSEAEESSVFTRGALQLSLGNTRPPRLFMASRTLEVNSGNSGAWQKHGCYSHQAKWYYKVKGEVMHIYYIDATWFKEEWVHLFSLNAYIYINITAHIWRNIYMEVM